MSSSQNPSPSKNDETLPPQTATSPSYESLPQQITIAYPISTIFPEEITKRKKISAKKTTPKKTQSTSCAPSASKQTGKKSKSTPRVVHTMRELYLDNPAIPNVNVDAEASESSEKKLTESSSIYTTRKESLQKEPLELITFCLQAVCLDAVWLYPKLRKSFSYFDYCRVDFPYSANKTEDPRSQDRTDKTEIAELIRLERSFSSLVEELTSKGNLHSFQRDLQSLMKLVDR
ncbi:unnamed protein product [Trifolium pratense]|uniref:Uncharacterized protein n=1 Tax=Trifolium pratense TaxID=57577 RepID=A0ACB0KNU5_TRIPR|nr:unnamed protein product [Trifolium pratense]